MNSAREKSGLGIIGEVDIDHKFSPSKYFVHENMSQSDLIISHLIFSFVDMSILQCLKCVNKQLLYIDETSVPQWLLCNKAKDNRSVRSHSSEEQALKIPYIK